MRRAESSHLWVLAVFAALLFATTATVANAQPCTPSLHIDGDPCVGSKITFTVCADPGCFVCTMFSFSEGPLDLGAFNIKAPIGWPFFPLLDKTIPPNGDCCSVTVRIPDDCRLVGTTIYHWTFGTDYKVIRSGPGLPLTLCASPKCKPVADCVVIIDEETIDNDIKTIEAAAAKHNVTPDYLVNDDRPTEGRNPWLRWNTMFAGDTVILPGGQVDDEGWFALPKNTPWSVADFVAGTIPQNQLDKIADVMPLRNHEPAAMRGRTCVAVVYDSDISMNYKPINANLQGARYGLFAFTVLDVILPGTLSESKSDTSLYDLLLRVEGPLTATNGIEIPVRDHEPDAIEIKRADFTNGVLTVEATSDFAPTAKMTVSVDRFTFESPMTYNSRTGRYEISITALQENLDGRRVTVSTDVGGAYNAFVQ